MSLCAYCGHPSSGSAGLCTHHALHDEADWAASNRVMCDFVHRGITTPAPIGREESSIELLVGTLEASLTQ